MAYEFKFPDVGEGITEGTIVKWKVKEGDNVEADQILAEVEVPSPKKGAILKLSHREGETINVGEVLAVIGEKGEKLGAKKEEKSAHYTGSVVGFLPEAEGETKRNVQNNKNAVSRPEDSSVKASPIVRKLAKILNVDLSTIKGTGANGIITEEDVKKAVSGAKAEEKNPEPKKIKKYDFFGYVDHVPLKGIRKITAEKM